MLHLAQETTSCIPGSIEFSELKEHDGESPELNAYDF